MDIVECVPNVSEGRRPEVIQLLAAAASSVAGARLLDVHSDVDHHRSVFTIAGSVEAVGEAAYCLAETAVTAIDMHLHHGVHPRIGALDVLPFVPLGDTSMERCVSLAHAVGERIAHDLHVPVYFYGEAALRPDRRFLVNIRRGEYEGLAELIQTEPARAPDAGPAVLGPGGATAVGARRPLVAFNVHLHTSDFKAAQVIAKAVRASSGGLLGVQALAFKTSNPDVVQISMNLFDLEATSVAVAVARVQVEAAAHGIEPGVSELVGMIPLREVEQAAGVAITEASSTLGLNPQTSYLRLGFAEVLAGAAYALRLPKLEIHQVIELAMQEAQWK